MNIDFAFICDFAEATGKLNALGIGFDTIYAPQMPARHPHFSLVLQLRTSTVEAGHKRIQVNVIDDDGKDVIPPVQTQVNIPRSEGGTHSMGRFVVEFGNLEFKQYGAYSVRVTVEGVEVASIPFRVVEPPKTQ
jgi:hypothetical protein